MAGFVNIDDCVSGVIRGKLVSGGIDANIKIWT